MQGDGRVGWVERSETHHRLCRSDKLMMGFAGLNPSCRLRLNLLAKIGLLWYEINDLSDAKKPAPCERCHVLNWFGTDHFVLAKTKLAVFYGQMRQAELENSLFSQMNSLFGQTNSLFC